MLTHQTVVRQHFTAANFKTLQKDQMKTDLTRSINLKPNTMIQLLVFSI
jgi:hypothetical protein